MTTLPEELHKLVCAALAAVDRHPQHDLSLGYRQAIGRSFGPHRNSGLPASLVAHRRRVGLAILTVRHVIPLWEERFPEDESPHRFLEMAEGVLSGEVETQDALREAERFWYELDTRQMEIGVASTPMALAVGYGAASALIAAVGEAWDDLDDKEIDYETVDSRDFNGNDTAFYAAIAYADGPIWKVLARTHPDAEKRREFWNWWLTQGVLKAWEDAT